MIQTDGVVSVGVSLSFLLSVFTIRIDALEFVKVLSMDFQIEPVTTVWTQPGGTLAMLCGEPLMLTALAFILLDFAWFAGSGYSGVGVDECVRSRTFWADNVS